MQLGGWRCGIWASTWVMGRCVPKLTRRPAAWPSPKTKKEVRQFLGLAGYYRRFIPNFSDLTRPLTDLTKKEAPEPVQWTEPCQQALTKVKAALCGGPLLHSPNFDLPFLLQTDASDRGLSAVLAQVVGGEERPVLYTAPWRRSAWPSVGPSSPSATTSWVRNSPSVQTTRPSSGSTT